MTDRTAEETRAAFQRECAVVESDPDNIIPLLDLCARYEQILLDDIHDYLEARLSRTEDGLVRVVLLYMLARATERRGRLQNGLSLLNGKSLADCQFKFGRGYLKKAIATAVPFARHQPELGIPLYQIAAEAAATLGDLDYTDQLSAKLRSLGDNSTVAATIFDPAFHDSLPDAAHSALEHLPSVSWVRGKSAGHRRVIWVCGDYQYFDVLGWLLIESLHSHRDRDLSLVLHLMDMTQAELAETLARLETFSDLDIAVSTEWTGLRQVEKTEAARNYYHSIRFIRFWEFLSGNAECNAALVDMDTFFNRSPSALLDVIARGDVALRTLPVRLETRNKVHAACVGVSSTLQGRNFFRNIAGYLAAARNMRRLVWGIDQVALYAVLVRMTQDGSLNLAAFPDEIIDDTFEADRVVWSSGVALGSEKHSKMTARIHAMRGMGRHLQDNS